jgi:hypothetical protein
MHPRRAPAETSSPPLLFGFEHFLNAEVQDMADVTLVAQQQGAQ